MTSSSPLTLVSTFTNDYLRDEKGQLLEKRQGGAAFFISAALDQEKIVYKLYSNEVLDTQIKTTGQGEFGKVTSKVTSKSIRNIDFTDWVIISTLVNEWDLSDLPDVPYIFLDIQGLVRDGRDFGKKKTSQEILKIYKKIFCIKGTSEEIAYLPRKILDQQKSKMLIVTHGGKGAEITFRNKTFMVCSEEILRLSDTVGAGDTFLGHFVAAFKTGLQVQEAGELAASKTLEFLRGKTILKNQKIAQSK